MSFTGPLLVVGMPRSGTKLLRGLLNEHSRIGIPLNETELLPAWHRQWASFGDLSDPAVFQRFYDRVTRSVYFVHRLEEHGQRIDAATWHAACQDFSLPGVFEALIRHDADVPRGSGGIWGDKSPGYLPHLPLLVELFPQARIIHIIRDVRDYCLSMKKAFGKSTTRAAQRWRDRILLARQQASTFPPGQYIEVRYEALLADPEAELIRLTDFLGLPFEPGMLTLSRATENIGAAKGARTIKRDNTEKWRQEMSPRQLALVERIAGDVMRSLGAELPAAPRCQVSAPHMALLQAHDAAQLTWRQVQKRGLREAVAFQLRLYRETRQR